MRKRIFAILAAVFVLISALPLAVFAEEVEPYMVDICTVHTVAYWRSYDNDQHQAVCGVCELPFDKYEPHSDYTYTATDRNTHYVNCGVCVYLVEEVAHNYENGVCEQCGFLEANEVCVHSSEVWYYESVGIDGHVEKCSACNKLVGIYASGQIASHEWNAGVITKEPTDTENGVKTFSCYACGETKTEPIFIEGSCTCTDHEGWSYVEVEGGHRRKCPICYGLYGAVESHKFTNYSQIDGNNHTVSCADCHAEKTEACQFEYKYIDVECHQWACKSCGFSGEVMPHTWNNGVVTKQPTKTENGVRTYTCTVCAGTKTETIDYIDLDELIENMTQEESVDLFKKILNKYQDVVVESMTQEEATDLYKKIFDKYQTALVKDGECMKPYLAEFVSVIFPDIAENGSSSEYYAEYEVYYYELMSVMPSNSSDYTRGYNDALATVIDENPVQGLFQGIWSGIVHFIVVVGNGVSIGGVTLMSVLVTCVIFVLVFFVVKLLRK